MQLQDALREASNIEITVTSLLRQARKLIEDPEHWTQHHQAVTHDGEPANAADDDDAYAFCIDGALCRTAFGGGNWDDQTLIRAYEQASQLITDVIKRHDLPVDVNNDEGNIPAFNDCEHTSHDTVLMVLDLAIADAASMRT